MQADAETNNVTPSDPTFQELREIVVGTTGNFRLSERSSLLLEKAQRRLRTLGLQSLEAYVALLKQDSGAKSELDCLIAELTIGETSFFRHPEHFEALRDVVLPACLRRNEASRQLRIWSAGCANGAEAYSIAIVVHSLLGEKIADWNVSIVGSDINRAFLAVAEAGSYSAWTFRNVPADTRPAFFARDGEATWSVRDRYRSNVTFVYHNLITDVPSLHKNIFAFDIVFCRNVMIYFNNDMNIRLAESLDRALVDDGYLFVAPADFHSHLSRIFTPEKAGDAVMLLRKKADASAAVHTGHPAAPAPAAATSPRAIRTAPASRRQSVQLLAAARRTAAPAARKPAPAQTAPDIATIISFANRGDWANAARHCEEVLTADACNAAAHYYHGLILQVTGAREEAERSWRRAVYLDRSFALAHYQIGLARKDARDVDGSRRAFSNTITVLSDTPDDRSVSPCDQITALDLRELAAQQLQLLASL